MAASGFGPRGNLEEVLGMDATGRKLVWVKREDFQGWACSQCTWRFNPAGPLVGESIDEMKTHYEEQRDQEFKSHVCAKHPGSIRSI
jgi:rubredoxin